METINNKLTTASLSDTREVYEAPVIEAVEVSVEQGFQASTSNSNQNHLSEEIR